MTRYFRDLLNFFVWVEEISLQPTTWRCAIEEVHIATTHLALVAAYCRTYRFGSCSTASIDCLDFSGQEYLFLFFIVISVGLSYIGFLVMQFLLSFELYLLDADILFELSRLWQNSINIFSQFVDITLSLFILLAQLFDLLLDPTATFLLNFDLVSYGLFLVDRIFNFCALLLFIQ